MNAGDSYWFHAQAWIPSVGSCQDALTSDEGCEQANEARPASLILGCRLAQVLNLEVFDYDNHVVFADIVRDLVSEIFPDVSDVPYGVATSLISAGPFSTADTGLLLRRQTALRSGPSPSPFRLRRSQDAAVSRLLVRFAR